MKWINRGHEYDETYKHIENKNKFYLFGAGDYGHHFYEKFNGEIEILGFIDNDEEKQKKGVLDMSVKRLSDIRLKSDEGIVVTMSQIARINPVEQLNAAGYKKNEDYFIFEDFISIYFAYKHNKVYFSSISFLPSTACNLNCKHCLNFNPYAKKAYVRNWDNIINDVDLFFSCVDHIMIFHVSGGEPMLYARVADLIEYIDKNYGHKIDVLRTVTNGTVIPNEKILEKLSKCNVEVTVDDYREAVPQYNDNFDKLIKKLEQYRIKYYINKVDSWIDLAPERTDYSGCSEEELMKHRTECNQSCQELRDGKIYSCNYAAYATVAGIAGDEDIEEAYDLRSHSKDKQKELIEFRLGYTSKGYTNFCKKCRGFTSENSVEIKPAIQCEHSY